MGHCELLQTRFKFEDDNESIKTQYQKHKETDVKGSLQHAELAEYMWQVTKVSKDKGLQRNAKPLKQTGSNSSRAGSSTSSRSASSSSTGQSHAAAAPAPPSLDDKTSAAPPSIGWDATMILAFLIVVFIAN